ncbi:glycosyltransferase involved in cell wall biosynthesis [Lysobacter niastensis]|uniref:Glycosyltransferase involved in cell wall biosynthesis n=1 Tax=Lysobacter niastensis TaxID=380629 RepID=A0ABU1WEL8_9GAMM|nr:glycosyltransferase [Lysobacter niastensis]MDR7135855.1 glycosyltransferase involved in cell wall biosynthesis [Lysobacter niastensis]
MSTGEVIAGDSRAVLYVSYDGVLEPLGQSQVLAYLEHLSVRREIHLLSFEKPGDWADRLARDEVVARMKAAGIHWHPRRYHKRPTALATSYDIAVGVLVGFWLILSRRIRTMHARSYVPAVMALTLKRLTGVKFVFDMRGFWADERVDGGLWPREGRMYRVAKWFERRFLLSADHVVALTHASAREMGSFPYLTGRIPPVTVIPTCADLARFRPGAGVRDDGFVLGYVGSAGTWYLFDAVAACFKQLLVLRPDARLRVVNRHEHGYIRERLAAAGVPHQVVDIRAVSHAEVPAEMAQMHAGIFFYKPSYSRMACAPTKLGEFLGCGIPCLSNRGVGDMAEVLEGEGVGVALDGFDESELQAGLNRLLALVATEGMAERCVTAAKRHFSLEQGVARYRAIHDAMEPAS